MVSFEPLDPAHHDRAAFVCGEPTLDRYLKTLANQDMRRDLAKCFVLVEAPGSRTIVGYYTLTALSINVSNAPNVPTPPAALQQSAGRYAFVPAALIGRLAVAQPYHGRHLGEALLLDALHRCVASDLAVKAVVVDALHEQAAAFYLRYGFERFADRPLRLYLPMPVARTLFPGTGVPTGIPTGVPAAARSESPPAAPSRSTGW